MWSHARARLLPGHPPKSAFRQALFHHPIPPKFSPSLLPILAASLDQTGQKKCCLTSSYTPSCATGVTTSGSCEITTFTVPGRKRGLVISITPRMSPLRLSPDNRHQPDSGYRWLLFFVAAVFLGAFVCFFVSVCWKEKSSYVYAGVR